MLEQQTAYGLGYSATAPNEAWTTRAPRGWQRGDDFIVIWPGSHAAAFQPYMIGGFTDLQRQWDALALPRFKCISGDLGQTLSMGTYCSPTALSRTEDLVAFARGSRIGAQSSKPFPMNGGSGGGGACLRYALAHPDQVSALALFVPLVDVRSLYDLGDAILGTSGISQAEIRAAHGAPNSAALYSVMPTRSPFEMDLEPLAGVPIRLYYSTDDPLIFHVPEFADLVNDAGGQCEAIPVGPAGHGLPPDFDYAAVARWLRNHS